MPQDLHGSNFEPDSRQIFAELLLVHDLDGHLLSGQEVGGELDLGEAAGADGLVQLVLTLESRVGGGDGQRRRQRRFARTFRRHRVFAERLFRSQIVFLRNLEIKMTRKENSLNSSD